MICANELDIEFYCLSFYEEKRENMKQQFQKLNINCKFHNGVSHDTAIINKIKNNIVKKNLSMVYGYLEIMHHFINKSNATYAIICEDDICIHKDFLQIIYQVKKDFKRLELNLLLLGYMIPYQLTPDLSIFYKKIYANRDIKSFYYKYPDCMNGTQMFMITKEHAKYLFDLYNQKHKNIFANNCLTDTIILQHSSSVLLYPMVAVENDEQTDPYHKLCHKKHYDNNLFL